MICNKRKNGPKPYPLPYDKGSAGKGLAGHINNKDKYNEAL